MSTVGSDVTHMRPDEKRALLEKLLRERKAKAIPLSPAQKRLWFLDQLQPNSPVYNVPTVLRLKGRIELETLRKGLETIVQRHQSLRTTFQSGEDGPTQRINPAGKLDLPLVDYSGSREPARSREVAREIEMEVRRPFNLTSDVMIRGRVVRLGPEEHVVILVTHHIASDEWSLRLLLAEWAELYAAGSEGREPNLPELPMQYSEFALWQERWLRSDECRTQIDYWTKRLRDAEPLQLPTTWRRPTDQTLRGAQVARMLPRGLADDLQRWSKEQGVTLFMTLLAAFKAVLYRYTQQEDIVVGCPIAGRNGVETERLIGFFVNTLAIRNQVNGEQTFRALLRSVREETLGAFANQDVPFDRVVEESHPERSSGRMPLVQVVFALNNDYVQQALFPGVVVEEIQTGTGTAKFDLTFVTRVTPDGLQAIAEYNADLFDGRFLTRFLGHYEEVLKGVLARPDEAIGRLPLMRAEEREFLVRTLNATTREYPRDKTVHELFEAQVAATPDAIAVSFGTESITYRELNTRANQLAHYLRKQNAGTGALVGVYMERSVRMITAFLGILKAGAAYVPLDRTYPAERIAFMVRDTGMPLILTQRSLANELPGGTPAICLDEAWTSIAEEPRQLPVNSARAESLAYIIYTSGSTGQPKGVAVPHRGITRLVCNSDYASISERDRVAQASNASFDAATFEIWGALLNGARLVGISRETALSPVDLAAVLREERVSILFLTTALFNQLARETPGVFAEMNTVLFGGENVDPSWVRAVLACDPPRRLLHVYGPTENTTFSSWHHVKTLGEEDLTVPIGKPVANSELFILDANRQPVPLGIRGEIYVGGDGLAQGYWRRPELSVEAFVPHPFSEAPDARLYRTGDLARFNEEGEVEFIGREDHQVKLRGFRIELGEIEAALLKHPAVSGSVVMLREDMPGEKRLVAYVLADEAAALEIRNLLRAELPEYMVPACIVFLESFPLTPNQKIDRKALPAPDQNRPAMSQFVAPRDEVERQLAGVWEKVLNVQPVGVRDNFFELGGHSLLAVRVFTQIEKLFGRKLPLATLFRAPTIQQMAALLREERPSASWSTLVEIQPYGSKPPFFWIHTLGGDGGGGFFYYRKLAELLGPDQPSFGIRSPQEPFDRIEEMARFYISEIRKTQPEGPYYLGGFCFGGNVAYEMAQQLLAAGQEVGLLVLLESSPPNIDHRQSWSATAAKYSIENLVENVREFVAVPPQQQLTLLKSKSKRLKQKLRNRMAPAGAEEKKSIELKDVIDLAHYPEGYVKYAETHWHALTRYHPRPYAGEIVLFRAKKQGLTNFNHTLGWDALVEDRVEVNVIPGTHESMLQEPNVQIVATRLRSLLAGAHSGSDAKPELAAAV